MVTPTLVSLILKFSVIMPNSCAPRGIATSTVGIGDQYSSEQLQALADNGGGMLHDAQFPHEIIEVVLGELHTVQDTIFEDISVELSFLSTVKVENLSAFPTILNSSSAEAHLGMLAPQRNRNVIFPIDNAGGTTRRHHELRCELLVDTNRNHGTRTRKQLTKALTFVNENRNTKQPRKAELECSCRKVLASWNSAQCVALNKRFDLKELERYLDHELKYFTRYCQGLRGTEYLVAELQGMRERANRRMGRAQSQKHGPFQLHDSAKPPGLQKSAARQLARFAWKLMSNQLSKLDTETACFKWKLISFYGVSNSWYPN